MSIIKVGLPFYILQRIKSQNDSVVFVIENDFENQNCPTFDLQNQKEPKASLQKPKICGYTPNLFIPEFSQAQPFI